MENTFLLFISMISIVSVWFYLYGIFIGWGLLVRHPFKLSTLNSEGILESLWIGWITTLLLLQVWHLFSKITSITLLPLSLGGLVGIIVSRRKLLSYAKRIDKRKLAILGCLVLIAALGVANISLDDQHYFYDLGLYYLQSVRWVENYSIVPGLGNLHHRLADNTPYFLYAALVDLEQGVLSVSSLASGSIMVAILISMIYSSYRLLACEDKNFHHKFFVLMIPLMVFHTLDRYLIVNFPPDFPIYLIGILILVNSIILIQQNQNHEYYIFLIILLVIAGIQIKLSFVVFGCAFIILVIVYCWYKGLPSESGLNKKALLWAGVYLTIFLGIWALRGIISNGYIISSLGIGGVPVEWRTPIEIMIAKRQFISSYARFPWLHFVPVPPKEELQSLSWTYLWIKYIAMGGRGFWPMTLPFLITFGGWVTFLLRRILVKQPKFSPHVISILLIPLVVNVVFWFFSAPAPRFAGITFWGIAAISLILIIDNSARSYHYLQNLAILLLAASLALTLSQGYASFFFKNPGIPTFPDVVVNEYVTDSGLNLLVPAGSPQCWDAPLPCTPYPSPNIRLRIPGKLESGFIWEKETTP